MKTLEIGRITKPHGLRGELKLELHWAGSTALGSVGEIIVRQSDGSERVLGVQSVHGDERHRRIKFFGIDDIAQAEALRGATVHVREEQLPPLEAGEYYLADLVGARVLVGADELGTVVEIRPYPSVDVMVIQTSQGKLVEQPILDCWLDEVDVARREVRLSSTDGLID